MLFQWIDSVGSRAVVTHDFFARAGQKIVGLRYKDKRPNEIILTQDELIYLLQNPDYAFTICTTLVMGHRAVKGSRTSYFQPMTDQEYLDDKGA